MKSPFRHANVPQPRPQAKGVQPRSVQFRREREARWVVLEDIVERALSGGLRSLPDHDLAELPVLYRSVLSSLSVARRTAMDRQLVRYLESLAARAYLAVYATRHPDRRALSRFLAERFPRSVRAIGHEVLLASLLLFLGVAVSYALVSTDPSWYAAFVDPALSGGRDPSATTEFLRDALYDSGDGLATFASFLFTHNARIGMLSFAVGVAAGVPTGLLIFNNGLMLGAFMALYADRGLLVPLLGWLLPHGVPEIGALILCGAAGLHLGRAVLLPGQHTVREAVARAGRRAAMVVAGCVVLFAIAGAIEGVFRQLVGNDLARMAVASCNLLWLLSWLGLAGRGSREAAP